LRQSFKTNHQALLHGDLHSGSIMVNERITKVIDYEFATYGPMGYDLGNFMGALQQSNELSFQKGRAYSLFVLAQLHRDSEEYDKALDEYNKVILIARALKLIQLEAAAYHSLSGMYRKKSNLEAALQHARKALLLSGRMGISYFEGQACMNMGMVYREIKDIKKAISYFVKARISLR